MNLLIFLTTVMLLSFPSNASEASFNYNDLGRPLTPGECFIFSQSSLNAQKQTAQAVIDAYNAWDINRIMALRAPECRHEVFPLSMGRSPQSNREYREYLGTIMPLYSNFTVTVLKEIHDTSTHTCAIHGTSIARTKIGQYTNEYAILLTFTADGRQISKFEEFVDSAYTEQFMTALDKANSSL